MNIQGYIDIIRVFIIVTLIALVWAASEGLSAQTPTTPGKPTVSITAGDRQLTVNWTAASAPADKPVIDYEIQYRSGTSGDWSNTATSYSISADSGVLADPDPAEATWAHNRDPLDLGAITGDAATYLERVNNPGSQNNLPGVYRVKADVGAVRIRVDGDAGSAATIRASYTTAPITDLRHNGTELARITEAEGASGFFLSGVTPPLPPNSYIWVDGWDHSSTNTTFPEFASITVQERRLRIDIGTVSTATNTTISGLVNQRSYQVRIRARNSAGWGAWSDISSRAPLGTPDAPTGLTLESGNQRFVARWSAPTNTGGYAISDYDIQYRVDKTATWSDWQASTVSAATSATITGLTNGTKYQVRVRAANSAGDGPWLEPVTDTVGKPSAPTFTISPVRRPLPVGKYDKGGLLSIGLSADNNGSDITDYDLRYRRAGTTTWYTYRDRSHDSGKLTTSETSGAADPIDFGAAFGTSSTAVAVTRESIGTNAGVYKFSKAVDQLWIRASGTISGGGTVVARWHREKPTAANLATVGTQIFSATTESDNTFWQDGWIVDLPKDAYVWFYTTQSETLTKRRLLLDFTDNSTSMALPDSLSSVRQTDSDPSNWDADDPIDFGTFTGTLGGVSVMREQVDANSKYGLYKLDGAVDRLWIRVSGKARAGTAVHARWHSAKPSDLDADGKEIFKAYTNTQGWFIGEGGGFNLPADGYIWLQTEGARTVSEHRLRLDATGAPMVMSGLWNGRTYELQARAQNARGWGVWSSASATTGVPMRPDMDAPTAGHQTLAVSWDPPWSDNGWSVSDYDVRYRAGSSGAWTTWPHNGTTRSTTITGLTNNTEYEIQVRATNARGASFWSHSVTGTPTPQKPDAPAAPSLTSSGTTMTANWTAPSANGAAISDYDIEYSSDSGTTWTPLLDTTFTSSKYTDSDYSDQTAGNPIDLKQITGLPVTITREQIGTHWGAYKVEGVLGALKVRVYGKTGQLDYVRIRYGSTKPTANLDTHAPSMLLDEQLLSTADFDASGTIDLPPTGTYFWVYTSTNTEITERTVEVSTASISTATSDTISGLTNATTYQVRVRARNSVGSGDWSTAATHTIGRPSAPAAPTLTASNAQLTATWSAASDSGSAIIGYDVEYCSSNCASDSSWTSIADTTDSTALTATITGLNNGTTYQVRVSAQNSIGNGPWSPAASIKVGLPGVPSAVSVVSGDGTLSVSWAAVSGHGSPIIDYDVQYCDTNCDGEGAAWVEHSPGTNAPFTFATLRNLTNGTEYQIRVRADNQHGSGLWSATVTKTPGTPAAPSAPTLTAADHKIVVEWSAPADHGGTITDYDVQYKTSSATEWTDWQADATDSTETMAVITGLEPTTTYQVQLQAENARGKSDWSASSTLTLPVSPVPNQSYPACDPANVTQLWVDDGCYLKAGVNGIKQFDAAAILGSGGDYVRLSEYQDLGVVDLTAYNPLGGLAVVQTTLNGVVQDTFLIDVIQFSIRSYSISGLLKVDEYFYLTVRLHSPDHGSPDKHMKNSNEFARSWVQLIMPGNNVIVGQDHESQWKHNPIQVVDQHGDSVTFKLSATQVGSYGISINAYRPNPDASCPTEGDLRCFVPPVDGLTETYVVAEQASFSASVAAPDPPGPVSSVSVTRADGMLTATWPAADRAASYHVTYSSNGGQSWSLAAYDHTSTSITINAANSDTYIVAVRARNSGGASGWRNSAPAGPFVPPTTQPPAAVASVSVTRADGTLTASWDAPDGATNYHITYTNNGGQSWSLAAFDHTSTTIAINVVNSDTYIVGVRAKNSAGGANWVNSPASGPFTPPPTNPPSAVPSVSVSRADGTLTASWDAPDGATSYHITYSSNGGQSWSLAAFDHTPTSITIDADNSETYLVGVRAKNSVGGSGWVNSPAASPFIP